MHSLFKNVEARRLTIDGTNYILAAGTSDVNSGSVDMLGYQGVAFMYMLGTLAASSAVTISVQQSDDDGVADAFSDLLASSEAATASDDNKLMLSEVYRPTKRYVRVATVRGDGGNSTIDGLVALLYRPSFAPVTQGATVLTYETANGPAEGTA